MSIDWRWFALGSAGFAALTAIFGKIGVVLVLLFSVLFLGETLTWKVALGATLVGAGAVLMAL